MPQILSIPESAKQHPPLEAVPRTSWSGIALGTAVIGILLTCIWFRVEHLDRVPGLNGDEAWSGVQAIRFLQGERAAWRTPTGNPLNVFFWGPLVALHAIFPPSIAVLRSVSVVSGMLAIGLNFWLCRRTLDRETATISTILLAVLPLTIAYSRFAWDACQTPLASVLVIYASLAANRSLLAIGAALAAAILIHPTNLFLAPIALACAVPPERLRLDRRLAFGGVLFMATVLFACRGPGELTGFLFHLVRLFSGSTVYQFISGGVNDGDFTVADWATLAAFLVAFVGEASRIRAADDPRDYRLALGTSASLVAFFVVAGPRGVQPHFERYAIWCIVPLVLIASRGAAWWLKRAGAHKSLVKWSMLCYATVLLVGIQIHYFNVFLRTGGDSHLAFRSAETDPKQAALAQIQAEANRSTHAVIVSHNWWTRLPMQYLSAGDARLQVVDALPGGIAPDATWFVELAGSGDEARLSSELSKGTASHHRSVYTDRAGRAVVVVYAPQIIADDSLKNFARPQFDNEAN